MCLLEAEKAMTAKEYLRQIATLDAKIEHRQRELAELKSLASGIRSPQAGAKVQSSPSGDKMAGIVSKWIDLEEEINDLIDQLVDAKHKIIGEIHQLSDSRYIRILEMRYVELKSWEEIAVAMHYTIRRVYQIHGYALQDFSLFHKDM